MYEGHLHKASRGVIEGEIVGPFAQRHSEIQRVNVVEKQGLLRISSIVPSRQRIMARLFYAE